MDQGGNYWTLFTPGIWKLLHAVSQLSGGSELTDYASGRPMAQPIVLIACTTPDRASHARIRQASAVTTSKIRTP